MNQWRNNEKATSAYCFIIIGRLSTEAVLPARRSKPLCNRVYLYQNKTTENNSKLIVVQVQALGSGCFTGVILTDNEQPR
jgi:hypothetical protein